MFADREYQTRILTQVRNAVTQGKRKILVVLPTGGGKAVVAARIMQQCVAKESDNIFFAAQRELIFQLRNKLDAMSIPCNVIMNGVVNEYQDMDEHMSASLCNVVAKDTLWARAFRTNKIEHPPARLIQIDEAHGAISKTYQSIAEYYSDAVSIGWTATPVRGDGRDLGEYYDSMICGATYKELQESGYLCPVKAYSPERPNLKGLKTSNGDYAKGGLQKRMNKTEMVGNIVSEWEKHSQGRQTVVFASGIDHSIHIRNEFRLLLGKNPDGTHRAEHIDGKTPQDERDDIMSRIADGRVVVVSNYGVLHTGVDCPNWKYMICARPTKSFSLWRQMGGRIQRPVAGHDHCFIQDHSDNCLVFGYPDEDVAWELNTDVRAQNLPRTERKTPKRPDGSSEPDPYCCGGCGTRYRGPRCPVCGTKYERDGEEVEMTKGELRELERKRINRKASITDKQSHWDKCMGIAIGRGMKIGAAAGMYREKFGVWPRNLQFIPRSSEWRMTARDYYNQVVKPQKDQGKKEIARELANRQLEMIETE